MKRTLLIFIVFFCSISIWAENNPGVNLQLASGKHMFIELEDRPTFTFEEDDIVITTNKIVLRFSSDELLSFSHVNISPLIIDDLETGNVRVSFTKDGIRAMNLKPNSIFSVYTQDGKLIYSSVVNEKGTVNALLHVKKGHVYIVKTSSTSFKIINR